MQLAQGATKGFDFALISELLALRVFDQFQNILHLINGALERFDDFHNFVDRLADGSSAMNRLGRRMADALGKALNAFQQGPRFGSARRRCLGLFAWFTGQLSLFKGCGFGGSRSGGFGCFGSFCGRFAGPWCKWFASSSSPTAAASAASLRTATGFGARFGTA